MASTSTKTSSSSSNLPDKYDVFLSFRGEDTRTNFVDHLYAGLVANGFHTFRDDEQLERGGEISSQLLDAIEESRICIVVFSENYADSRWCLNELLAISESIPSDDSRIALPIFYLVNPSDVRHQTGSYATRNTSPDEDADKEKVEMIKKWRNALTLAANLSGYHVDRKMLVFVCNFSPFCLLIYFLVNYNKFYNLYFVIWKRCPVEAINRIPHLFS